MLQRRRSLHLLLYFNSSHSPKTNNRKPSPLQSSLNHTAPQIALLILKQIHEDPMNFETLIRKHSFMDGVTFFFFF